MTNVPLLEYDQLTDPRATPISLAGIAGPNPDALLIFRSGVSHAPTLHPRAPERLRTDRAKCRNVEPIGTLHQARANGFGLHIVARIGDNRRLLRFDLTVHDGLVLRRNVVRFRF